MKKATWIFIRMLFTFSLVAIVLYWVGKKEVLIDQAERLTVSATIAAGTRAVIEQFQKFDILTIVVVLILSMFFISTRAFKWAIIIRSLDKGYSFSEGIISYICGSSFSILTPGRLGEISRLMFLKNRVGKVELTGSLFVDRGSDFITLTLLSVAGVYYFAGYSPAYILLLAVLIGLIIHFQIYINIDRIKRFLTKDEKKILKFFSRIITGLSTCPPTTLLIIYLLSTMSFTASIFQCYLLISLFSNISLFEVLKVWPLVLFTNILPITSGNLGIREGASVALFSEFNVPMKIAFNASLMIFLVDTFLPSIAGAFLINFNRKFSLKK